MQKNIIIATGGTGGHIFPAMAVARDIKDLSDHINPILMGGGGKRKSFLESELGPYLQVLAASPQVKNPLRLLKALVLIFIGTLQSLYHLIRLRPKLVLGMGSFYTFPILLAAKILRIPIYLHEGNAVLGKVNRVFQSSAQFLGMQFVDPKVLNAKWAPLPLRHLPSSSLIQEACRYFKIEENQDVLLVIGGSQGAQYLNQLMSELAVLIKEKKLHVLHIVGQEELVEAYESLYRSLRMKASVRGFEKRMDLAWSVATLTLSRAGAATIAEIYTACVPAIFIPYPYAADGHQMKNAFYVCDTVKGGVCVDQREATPGDIADLIHQLYADDKAYLKQLHQNLKVHKEQMEYKALGDVQVKFANQLLAAKMIKDIEGKVVKK